jgi:hypothetical protein
MYSLSKVITTISLIALTLGCFGLSPQARAVCQEGCLGNFNTALGHDALVSLTTGTSNTAIGFQVLRDNTSGTANTASGPFALHLNTTGNSNTAIGKSAMLTNTTGSENTAIGDGALFSNTTAFGNTATGNGALGSNTTGIQNTATGVSTLANNITGDFNTATGALALYLSTGDGNTANGYRALEKNRHGNFNTAVGDSAMLNNRNGNKNIALGYQAGLNLDRDNNIDIGNPGVRGDASTIRIGKAGIHSNTYIAGISGVTVAGGVGVIIDTDGHLGTVVSSERFKDSVRPMDKASETILALKPVTFRYKTAFDPKGIPQFGLVAEQVEKVNPDLVARDEQGKPYTVRYEAVNAMLLNEFLKEHRTVEELKKEIAGLKATMKDQAAQIQTVSAALETRKSEMRTIADNH